MNEKPTRGRASKVDLLPANIKTQLAMMLRDKQFSQSQILDEINELIRESGLSDAALLSKTGLNRYASKMEKMGAKIRQAREVAEVWTKQLGEAPQSDIGKLLMEAVKTMAFDLTLNADEEAANDPRFLNQLALIANRIEQAQSISDERERKVRKEVIEQAAKAVENAAKATGAKMEDVTKMVRAVYGIE